MRNSWLIILVLFSSCTFVIDKSTFNHKKFNKTKVHLTYSENTFVHHLKFKRGHHWTYYSSGFDICRSYTLQGKYKVWGDSIRLEFYRDSIPGVLTGYGVIEPEKERIKMLTSNADWPIYFYIKKGDLQKLK